MTPYTEEWYAKRSERMLSEMGLDQMVIEPIKRERVFDERNDYRFSPIEYQGLMVLADRWLENAP